jgi:hypothetical protein
MPRATDRLNRYVALKEAGVMRTAQLATSNPRPNCGRPLHPLRTSTSVIRSSSGDVATGIRTALKPQRSAIAVANNFAQTALTASAMPPSGRKVTRPTGIGGGPGRRIKRRAVSQCASTISASTIAKRAPTQTRGPAPNGRY